MTDHDLPPRHRPAYFEGHWPYPEPQPPARGLNRVIAGRVLLGVTLAAIVAYFRSAELVIIPFLAGLGLFRMGQRPTHRVRIAPNKIPRSQRW